MVARTPPKKKTEAGLPPPLDPILLRETINKVDKAIARLQELQFTVTGGEMVVSGVTLSPRSTRGYLRTSLKCKQETLRMKNNSARRSPTGNLPKNTGDWKRMSLPAMLLGETVGEILKASQFARQMVEASNDEPKTPLIQRKQQKNPENSELPARRKREKQDALQIIRSDSNPLSFPRAKSRINFKVSSSSPLHKSDCDKENCKYIVNRVSPRNKPWVKKTVLFPNPLFHSSSSSPNPNPTSKNQTSCKNKSPPKVRQTPHKFLIKSPPKMRSPQFMNSPILMRKKKSPIKESGVAAKFRRSFSPSRMVNKLASPLRSGKCVEENDGSKFRKSFSPSRLVTKFASPLRSGKCMKESDGIKMMKMMMVTTGQKKQRSPPKVVVSSSAIRKSVSPTNSASLRKRSSPPSKVSSSAIRKSLSPTNSMVFRKRLSPPPKESTAAKLRRSFSPSRLATKLASPLKSRKSVSKMRSSPPKTSTNVIRKSFSPFKSKKSVSANDDGGMMSMKMRMSGLKQRPIGAAAGGTPMRVV